MARIPLLPIPCDLQLLYSSHPSISSFRFFLRGCFSTLFLRYLPTATIMAGRSTVRVATSFATFGSASHV